MTIKVGVKRCFRASGGMDNMGDYEFVSMPREGDIMLIDGLAEGMVQRVEHTVARGKPPRVVIFIDC